MSYFVPTVIESVRGGERAYDLWSRLLKDRIVFLGTEIDDYVANVVVGQLLFLEAEDAGKDIMLYVNSPGGSVSAGLAIYDTMQYVQSDVSTICVGQACSMGAVLLAAGCVGKRKILPHARVMIHQPLGGAYGQASDIAIQAAEMAKCKKTLNGILAECCGKTVKAVARDSDRDCYMSAAEACRYGLVDDVVGFSGAPGGGGVD